MLGKEWGVHRAFNGACKLVQVRSLGDTPTLFFLLCFASTRTRFMVLEFVTQPEKKEEKKAKSFVYSSVN